MKREAFLFGMTAALLAAAACGDDATTDENDDNNDTTSTTSATGGNGGNPTTTTSAVGGLGGSAAGGSSAGGSSQGGSGGQGGGEGGQGGAPMADGTCAAPFPIAETETLSGDTTAATSLHHVYLDCQSGESGEQVYVYTPASSGAVTFTMLATTADLGIYVRRTVCADGARVFGCADDQPGGVAEELTRTAVAGEPMYIIVDGYETGTEGAYTLSVSAVTPEASCTDMTDDNGDGVLVDCEDPSCVADAACATAITNACAGATTLTPGTTQSGDTTNGITEFASWNPICSDVQAANASLYSYTPTQDEIAIVQLDSASDHGFYVRAGCASPAEQVICLDATSGSTEWATVGLVANQPYTFFVSAYVGGEEGPFGLDAQVFPVDETEPNNAYTTADVATGGEFGQISGESDVDWYKITVPAGGELAVAIGDLRAGDCAAGRVDTEIEIYDTDGTTSLAANDDVDATNENYCSATSASGLAAGDYFVRVDSSAMYCPFCTPAYALDVTITP